MVLLLDFDEDDYDMFMCEGFFGVEVVGVCVLFFVVVFDDVYWKSLYRVVFMCSRDSKICICVLSIMMIE